MKKLGNILAENMRRFNTKNLSETQLDMFNKQDGEYYHNRTSEYDDVISYEDLAADIKLAIQTKNGKEAIKVVQNLLKYITVDVYEKLKWSQERAADNPNNATYTSHINIVKDEINSIQQVNQDVLKNVIGVLKADPRNVPAMQMIYDIIDDLWSSVD
jgi:DNA polymerase elongation subunit (family B)